MDPRPGRGTFVAARRRPSRHPPPRTWTGRRSPSARGRGRVGAAHADGAAAAGRDRALERLPGRVAAADRACSPPRSPGPRAARARGARVPTEGVDRLRAWFAREAGGLFRAHDVVVTPGAQAALSTVLRVLAGPGVARARRVPDLPRDDRRRPDGGRRASCPSRSTAAACGPTCSRRRSAPPARRSSCCQPLYANPHGASLAPDRRAELLRDRARGGRLPGRGRLRPRPRARRRPAAAAGLGGPRRPRRPPALADQGGGARPARRRDRRARRGGRPHPRRPRRRRLHRRRPAAGGRARPRLLTRLAPAPPHDRGRAHRAPRPCSSPPSAGTSPARRSTSCRAAGFSLWVRLPDGLDDVAVAAAAEREGVVVSPGRPWFPAEPPGPVPAPDLRGRAGGRPRPRRADPRRGRPAPGRLGNAKRWSPPSAAVITTVNAFGTGRMVIGRHRWLSDPTVPARGARGARGRRSA